RARTTQRQSFDFSTSQQLNLSTIGSADSLPRAVVLVDVCRRLSRAENSKRGENRRALFPVRKVRGRFTRARAGRASIQRTRNERRDSPALSREVANQAGVHGALGRANSRSQSDFARNRLLRNGWR